MEPSALSCLVCGHSTHGAPAGPYHTLLQMGTGRGKDRGLIPGHTHGGRRSPAPPHPLQDLLQERRGHRSSLVPMVTVLWPG